ncbi:hypothetical protein Gpo141_00006531 [Globisporangium polare]
MLRVVMSPYALSLSRMTLRALQAAGSLVALSTLAAGFTTSELGGNTYRLGSHESSFLLLVTYSGLMYAGWSLSFVELCPVGAALRPRARVSRVVDALFAFFFLCASIALAASDYVDACSEYGFMLKCANLKTAVSFGFLTIVPFLGSIALTFVVSTAASGDMHDPQTMDNYAIEVTPTGALSPIGVSPTPSSKV